MKYLFFICSIVSVFNSAAVAGTVTLNVEPTLSSKTKFEARQDGTVVVIEPYTVFNGREVRIDGPLYSAKSEQSAINAQVVCSSINRNTVVNYMGGGRLFGSENLAVFNRQGQLQSVDDEGVYYMQWVICK